MRIKRGYLFRDFYSKEVSHHHLHVAETQIPVETQNARFMEENKRLQVCPAWRLLAPGSWRPGHPL